MRVVTFFFYLLLILAPTQLARHFFFDFSLIFGLRSDYLAPTVYLTDIIIILMLIIYLLDSKFKILNIKYTFTNLNRFIIHPFLLFAFCYLLFNIIFVASNQWVAIYKLLKTMEFIFLGYLIAESKPQLFRVIFCLSCGVFYSSIIAIWQFILQRSVGGYLWYLGERTFYANTPGIAAFTWDGRIFLRPYATFPHPNVLAGFLATVLLMIFYWLIFFPKKTAGSIKVWFGSILLLGFLALLLTYSRGIWLVAFFGLVLIILEKAVNLTRIIKQQRKLLFISLYILIFISIGFVLIINNFFVIENQSIKERANLLEVALEMLINYPLFGIGLNNYLVRIKSFASNINSLYLMQPVHNIYLLVAAETGIIGLTIFMTGFLSFINKSFKTYPIITIALLQLFLLGLFDHYLFTLQQGQLLLTLFFSFAFLKRNK